MQFDLGTETFDRLRDAELCEAYYTRLAGRLAEAERWIRYASLVTSSATVVGWIAALSAGGWLNHAWKAASVLTVLAVMASTVWRLVDRARMARELATHWTGLVGDLRRLDAEVRMGLVPNDRYFLLQERAEELQTRDLETPRPGWIRQAQAVVNARHADRAPA